MYKLARVVSFFVESPLHAGSGSDLGIVDLPIQRERHTSFPKIEGSSVKGALREAFEQTSKKFKTGNDEFDVNSDQFINAVFGPETTDANNTHAGALAISDARLLLFPVKSMKGVFAWITCPYVLQQFEKDLQLAGITDVKIPNCSGLIKGNRISLDDNKTVILEEYKFELEPSDELKEFAEWIADNMLTKAEDSNETRQDDETEKKEPYNFWKEKLKKDIVVLSDDEFKDFVNLSTEVVTRTKIDNKTGTVSHGALFTEEFLPTDSLLYSLVFSSPLFLEDDKKPEPFNNGDEAKTIMDYFSQGLPEIIQMGGDATIGKGFVSTKVVEGKNDVK